MSETNDPTSARKPRADAARNRALLLEAAKAAFADDGASISLEEIARTANVGIGTLYRHFPTREALIEAVYRNEMDQLVQAAARLSETRPPIDALREWLLLSIDTMATKRGLSEALNSIVGGTSELSAASGEQTRQAITKLVKRAVASGEVRLEIDPLDLLRALAGVSNISAGADWRRSARQFVDIMIAGLRVRGPDNRP